MQTIRANGLEFAFIEEGSGPLVLLLHGFPDTAHTWDDVRPVLAKAGYRAVSPFLRGYAPSEIRGPFDAETLGRDVSALLRELGGGQPAILVGHDWGAGAAYSAAAVTPELVRLLITVALPHPATVRPTLRALWGVRHFLTLRLPGAAARIRAANFVHIDELVQRWSPGWNVPPGETDAVKEAFRTPGSLEAAIGYYRAMRPIPSASHRTRISVPTVAFAALDDGILTVEDYHRAGSQFTGPYEVIPLVGGHFLQRQQKELFNEKLLGVLKERGA